MLPFSRCSGVKGHAPRDIVKTEGRHGITNLQSRNNTSSGSLSVMRPKTWQLRQRCNLLRQRTGLLRRGQLDREFLNRGRHSDTDRSETQQTDVFIMVTRRKTESFVYRLEVDVDHILRTESGHRKKISLYLYGPPATTVSEQGIPLDFRRTSCS